MKKQLERIATTTATAIKTGAVMKYNNNNNYN